VRKGKNNEAEIVFLDHGLYENLSNDTRINFAYFWRSIILQEKDEVRKYSKFLGTDLYKLFACIFYIW